MTTIHSNSCESTYRRMMTLAKRKYAMDDSILMQIMVEAYPVVVFTKQLEDRSRKIMEIIEGEDYLDGKLVYRSLYKYHVEDNVTDSDGNARVLGHHQKTGAISATLQKRLLDNGIPHRELDEFLQPATARKKAAPKTVPARKASERKPKTAAPDNGEPHKATASETEPGSMVSPEAGLAEYISEKYIPEKPAMPGTAVPGPPGNKQTINKSHGKEAD